jgi:hypothetical protein
MSAILPMATEIARRCNMSRRATSGLMRRSKQPYAATSLARAREGRRRRNAKGFGGLEVDRQLEFQGLHDRQIGRLFAFQNASRVRTGFPMEIREAKAADCDTGL